MPRVIITVPDRTPQPYKFQLDRKSVSIGRGSINDIAIDCGSVSVKHAEMVRVEGGYELRDLASTNGTKLDGVREEVVCLRHGMTVLLGDVAFDFQLSDDEREALGREKAPEDTPVIKERTEEDEASEGTGGKAPARRAAPRKPVVVAQPEAGGAWIVGFLLFLLFAGIAFFAGLSIRYYKDTDRSLFYDIRHKRENLMRHKKEEAARKAQEGAAQNPAPTPALEPAPAPVPDPAPAPEPAPIPAPAPEPVPSPVPIPGDPFAQ